MHISVVSLPLYIAQLHSTLHSCKGRNLCNSDHDLTHQGNGECIKKVIITYEPEKCQKCQMFSVNYGGQFKLCNGCWMDAIKFLKKAVANKQIPLKTVLDNIKEWKRPNSVEPNYIPMISFIKNNDGNGFASFELKVKMADSNDIYLDDLTRTNTMSSAISSPTISVNMSLSSAACSTNSHVHVSCQHNAIKQFVPYDAALHMQNRSDYSGFLQHKIWQIVFDDGNGKTHDALKRPIDTFFKYLFQNTLKI
uniref:Uncharacterized protein n=1 Tax=Tetranychus urticae TaxID=32264 RepID=T1KG96_TETUR